MPDCGKLGAGLILAALLAIPTSSWSAPEDASQEMVLQLIPGERLQHFANGCGVISTSATAPAIIPAKWYGACRFGLAHGVGVSDWGSGVWRKAEKYQYGVPLGLSDRGTSFPYRYALKDGFHLSRQLEDGRYESVVVQSPDRNIDTLTAGHFVGLSLTMPDRAIVIDTFRPVALECSDDGKANWKGLTVIAAESAAADVDCKKYWAGRGGKPTGGLMVLSANDIGYIEHAHWTRPNGGVEFAKELSARYCSGGSQSADCTRVLQEMLQPYATQIQAIIDGQRQQYAQGLPWLPARYAPLEAQRRQQWRALAGRYAAEQPAPGHASPEGDRGVPATRKPGLAPARRGHRS